MSAETAFIWVDRWDDFQTYTDKRGKPWVPPWIKIYPRLLDDPAFLELPAATRSLLVGIWMLFANSRGTVTNDTRSLSRRLNQRVTEQQLETLNHAGYIRFCSGTVREQLWNTFRNRSSLEGEVDKNTPTPSSVQEQKPAEPDRARHHKRKPNALHRAENFVKNAGCQYERIDLEEELAKFDLTPPEYEQAVALYDHLRPAALASSNGAVEVPDELPWEGEEPPVVAD